LDILVAVIAQGTTLKLTVWSLGMTEGFYIFTVIVLLTVQLSSTIVSLLTKLAEIFILSPSKEVIVAFEVGMEPSGEL
jgi:hypothetical protein